MKDPFLNPIEPRPSAWGRLRERWRGYTGDRDLEQGIRLDLANRGMRSGAARILETRLVAIERPGWVQVYRFEVSCEERESGRAHRLHGLARLDERHRSEIELFPSESDRDQQLDVWSEGLVRMRQRKRSSGELALIAVGVVALALAALTAVFGGG